MIAVLTGYMLTYGYLAIFFIVLMQELGMPGLPNELVLFYLGYLSREAALHYPLVICLVVLADVAGSFILYLLFFHGKMFLLAIKPRWIKLPAKKIDRIKKNILLHQERNLFFAKLTPFVRSYMPVAAGLLRVDSIVYGRVVILAALVWSGGWITAGWLIRF